MLFTRPFSGRMADKYGLDKILIPAMLMFALSFVLISFSRTLPMFLLSGAVSAFGYGICQPVIQTLCMKLVPQERRGIAGNTSYIGVDIGYLVTPSIAGAIVTLSQSGGGAVAGYAVMFQVMTLPIAIALVLFLFRRRRLMAAAESEA
ncbi:MFS transporter [Cohnella rhizosphaerae]|uniref:MFS transporter n=1 Tax=Cohnella rhizosphaerae TaxID=1457232 RepID=UPI003B8A5E40